MDLKDIIRIRLFNQQISSSKFKTVKEIAGWMGAMQAQDFSMAKLALGTRLPGSTEKEIESAYSNGDIIRTHVLRPTWHFILPEDLNWMRKLTSPRIKSALKSGDIGLGITGAVLNKSYKIVEAALAKGEHLTREELIEELKRNKIETRVNRGWHILVNAELDGLICSGKLKSGNATFAMIDERVPRAREFTFEESLALIAKKYFNSHGPASLEDFSWWSGLSKTESKAALELIKSKLISETIDGKTFWFAGSISIPSHGKIDAYLLPAFDEFIISYKDRSILLDHTIHKNAISNNGIFRPVILINGKASGIWKRAANKNEVIIEVEFFEHQSKIGQEVIIKKIKELSKYWNKEIKYFHNRKKINS